MKKKRILVAGQMPPPIGGQNLNIKRLHALLSQEKGVTALHWKFEFNKTVKGFRRLGFGKIVELFRVCWRLLRLRISGPIDAVIYPSGGPHLVPVLRDVLLLPVACLLTRRVWVHFRAAGVAERLPKMNPLLRWLVRGVHSLCHGGIVLSEYGRRDAQALGMRRIEVMPNGLEDYNPAGLLPSHADADRPVILLCVGHICEDKGTPVLIRAFGKVAADFPNTRLKLVGECLGPYTRQDLDTVIASTGVADRIDVVGLKQDAELMEEYRRGDLLVFPTVAPYESFGMVLIEGMMWGLPAVVSDWRACREVFGTPAGGICYSLSADHEQALTRTLREALEKRDEWGEWAARNRQRYENCYTIAALRRNLLRILQVPTDSHPNVTPPEGVPQ